MLIQCLGRDNKMSTAYSVSWKGSKINILAVYRFITHVCLVIETQYTKIEKQHTFNSQ